MLNRKPQLNFIDRFIANIRAARCIYWCRNGEREQLQKGTRRETAASNLAGDICDYIYLL